MIEVIYAVRIVNHTLSAPVEIEKFPEIIPIGITPKEDDPGTTKILKRIFKAVKISEVLKLSTGLLKAQYTIWWQIVDSSDFTERTYKGDSLPEEKLSVFIDALKGIGFTHL